MEAKHELKVNFNDETLPFFSEHKYLVVTLDRILTYRLHLEQGLGSLEGLVSDRITSQKLTSRVSLLRCLAGSGRGAENNVAHSQLRSI